MKGTCPICDETYDPKENSHGPFLLERRASCPNGHWQRTYILGYECTRVGDKEFEVRAGDDDERIAAYAAEVQSATCEARQKWRETHSRAHPKSPRTLTPDTPTG